MEIAIFSAGCFWGVEQVFSSAKGVLKTEVGYTGGSTPNPTYSQVCTGLTGHAEACRIEFDPAKTSFGCLLKLFWSCHDPTQKNRQGLDFGTQYRSAIFCTSEEQRKQAEHSLLEQQKSRKDSRVIVTEIQPAGQFWRAEEYHQGYFRKKGGGSCHF